MKTSFFALIVLLLGISTGNASSLSTLSRLDKGYHNNSMHLSCTFNTLPQYTLKTKGKRTDLILENTITAEKTALPETDDKLVKILSRTKNHVTTLSLFFRYPPQRIKPVPGKDGNTLVLDILLGNEFTASRPILTDAVADTAKPSPQQEDPADLPVPQSPYSGNWKQFFKAYETVPLIELPVQFSLPPFPAITLLPPDLDENLALLPSEILEGAKQGLWNDQIPLILERINHENNLEFKKKLTLIYCEILLRAGKYKDAYEQLYLLMTKNAEEPIAVLAKYLLLRLQAEYADTALADIELRTLETAMDKINPATPYFILTQIETALATRDYERMGSLLERDDIVYPAGLAPLKAMRQADYWLVTGEFIKAHAGYQLLEKSNTLEQDSSSLNRYCQALYHHQQFKQAADCYDRLAKHPSPGTGKHMDIISYRKAMARLHFTPEKEMINQFAQIETTYPDSEAGTRATLKQIDLKLLTLKNWGKQALTYYNTLAATATTRPLKEEATFKEALVSLLLDQKARSVELTMDFLREFRSSPLHDTAQALLVETLPQVLKAHIKNGEYIEALVLARRNKILFSRKWVDISLFTDVAEAYRHLGFFSEASRIYVYLLDIAAEENKAATYLPLIQIAFEQGDFETVEHYADQYTTRYPEGRELQDILYIRLQNLMTHNKYPEALALLSSHHPDAPRFKFLQATLSFHVNDYAKARAILEEMQGTPEGKQADNRFMLAESLYQLGDIKHAEQLFDSLQQDASHKDQVLFRLAEIARRNKEKEKALKLFKQIVDTGDSPYWKKLAKKELELTALSK